MNIHLVVVELLTPFEYEFKCRPCGTEYEYAYPAANANITCKMPFVDRRFLLLLSG